MFPFSQLFFPCALSQYQLRTRMGVQQFAINYYRSFASHCISFFERDASMVTKLLTLKRSDHMALKKISL
jgi:hypothetical protein